MKTCPWCEGKKVVGKIVHGDEPKTLIVGERVIPVVTMTSQPCGICNGTGEVSEERHLELTGGYKRCPTCNGKGGYQWYLGHGNADEGCCETCNGTGYIGPDGKAFGDKP